MSTTATTARTGRPATRVQEAVAGLQPGYFALVMATGMMSIGLSLEGFAALSSLLLLVTVVSYVVLVVLLAWRIGRHGRAVLEDLADPARAFGFFTVVAGTNVLGARLAMAGAPGVTAVLLTVSALTWFVLGYVVPWTAVLGRSERPVIRSANGTWFIWVVASQSIAVAAATVEPVFGGARQWLAVLAILCWSVGVFLYAAAGVFVALRLMAYPVRPADLTPPYWVAMGALAITVLAGARIVEMADAPMVDATRGLIAGLAVVFWAFATWLIPALVAAGWWRHVANRVPLSYEATLWSIVFPLGMYAVAGIYLGRADDLPIVGAVGRYELWVAIGAWLVTFVAMARHVVLTVVRPAPRA
jgi:tellurite resistance protein TehA-like permease